MTRHVTPKPPFPYFGGKAKIADLVWSRFGQVRNYVEPFFGSGAVLFCRPEPFDGVETVNDRCGFVANFWRAVQADPETVARYADWPVNENDLHARHFWLVEQTDDLTRRLEGDPDYFDAKIAGWWCWGMCCWIGSGWCSGEGSWRTIEGDDGVRRLVRVDDAGQGVRRQLVHLGDAGRGVNRQLVHLGNTGQGVHRKQELTNYFALLARRLRRVRVCSGDWSRVCGTTPTVKQGLTAVFLDPPYADTAGRNPRLYRQDSLSVAHAVRDWAIVHGDDPRMRIALCGYEGEHAMPDTWECVPWKTRGGYGNQGKGKSAGRANARRERVWFSPHCLGPSA